ncbi:MAG: helix-turn-helix transcriptional regulator [Terrisporobacter sp.]|uniref:helix-turn-helix domain-containing protein n=1 Tax=Terrisporobacter sp. TaxID=1965305 RepID=UPI002FCAB8D4
MELCIGEVIYKLRKEKGVTQENLANAVGISVAAVSKWESKSSYPDITILPSIARFFNTTIDKLLGYEIEISNEEEAKVILNKAINLLEESTKSDDKEIEEASKYILSSLYAMNDEYEKAEGILLTLPKVTSDRDDMLVGLYINQKKNEEAIKLLRMLTYKKLSNLIMSLGSYVSFFMQNENVDKAKEVLNLQEKLTKIFGVDSIY